jgi:hypothetical protein
VILYHFTSLYNLENVGPENIMAVGLKAMPVMDWPEEGLGGVDCVWLTANPDLPPMHSSHGEVRIKLVVPSSSRRLVHLPRLLRKRVSPEQLAGLDAEAGGEWRRFYMYLGDIPSSFFWAVEYADAARREQMQSV